MKKMSTESKLVFSFIMALILVMTAVLLQLVSLQNYKKLTALADHSRKVQNTQSNIIMLIDEAETNERAYIILGADYLRDNYRAAASGVEPLLYSLAEMTGDNPVQVENVKEFKILIKQRLRLLDEILSKYDHGGIEGVRESALKETVKSVRSSIAVLSTAIMDEEERLITARQQRAYTSANQAEVSGLVIIMVVVIGFAFIFMRFRREAAEERRKDKSFQNIFEIMPVGVFWTDAKGLSLHMNKAAIDIWGGSLDVTADRYAEYKGRHSDTGVLLDSGDWALARTLSTGETVRNDIVDIQGFDGSPRTIIVNSMPLKDETGTTWGAIATNFDVTEVREAQHDLEATARINETKRLSISLFTRSFDRKIIFDGLLSLLAKRCPFPVSAMYVYDEWSGVFHCACAHGLAGDMPDTFAPGEGIIGETARNGSITSIKTGMLRLKTGVGDYEPQEVWMVPIIYQEKRDAILVVGTGEKLSDTYRQFLETLGDQLGVALYNLKQYDDLKILTGQLRSSWEEIQEKNKQLEEASRMKSEFLANMSHELRTPLNAVIGFSEVLKDGLIGKLTDDQQEYIEDIFESGTHLLSLINDILDLSKVEAGKMQLQLEPISPASVVEASLQIIREKALAHNISLTTDVGKDIGVLMADERKLKQILYNLLSNAVKFTPEGGSVSVAAHRITTGEDSAEFLEFQVKDTGIGISKENQSKLFRPFVQIDSSLSRKFEGTGLGLAMIKRLTELHGGFVMLESEVNKGSSFIVRIPWRYPDKVDTVTPSADFSASVVSDAVRDTEAKKNSEHLVLIVEDDSSSAELMRLQLENLGYKVVTAASAEIAFDILSKEFPDLIILDILLPGMDGWEFLERIKVDKKLAMIPVVIASMVADGKKGIALGAAQVIQKPISRERLSATLSAMGINASKNKTCVLIIDDDPKSVQILRTYFVNEGYTVLAAYGGREGIARVREKEPDLIILDLMMPEVNGFDVVETLRKDEKSAAIPIIIVTAKQVTNDDRERLRGDVIRIIEKSEFKSGIFIKEIERALGKH
jgi:signal transduction histidine kinase/DNA-binding response OmpR family regulator/CHASE3 domain sensor protein